MNPLTWTLLVTFLLLVHRSVSTIVLGTNLEDTPNFLPNLPFYGNEYLKANILFELSFHNLSDQFQLNETQVTLLNDSNIVLIDHNHSVSYKYTDLIFDNETVGSHFDISDLISFNNSDTETITSVNDTTSVSKPYQDITTLYKCCHQRCFVAVSFHPCRCRLLYLCYFSIHFRV